MKSKGAAAILIAVIMTACAAAGAASGTLLAKYVNSDKFSSQSAEELPEKADEGKKSSDGKSSKKDTADDGKTEKTEKKSEKKTEKKVDAEQLYKQFVTNDLKAADCGEYPVKIYGGVISAVIEDFDSDGEKELLTVSFKNDDADGMANGARIVLDLYAVKNGAVELCGSSEEYYFSFSGYGSARMCCTYKNGVIRLNGSSCGFGGSNWGSTFASYEVRSVKLTQTALMTSYDFPRNNIADYKDELNSKGYGDPNEWYDAVCAAGFEPNKHGHLYADVADKSKADNAFTSEHFFAAYYNSNFNEQGETGYICDFGGVLHSGKNIFTAQR